MIANEPFPPLGNICKAKTCEYCTKKSTLKCVFWEDLWHIKRPRDVRAAVFCAQ